jgi:5-methylcytosine-specific restriction endonuclease McrA
MVQLEGYPEIHEPYGGVGLPIEARDNRSRCNEDHIITTDGTDLVLVIAYDRYMFTILRVSGTDFEEVNMRSVGWDTSSSNRPSQTHFNRMILSNLYGHLCMECGATDNLTVDHVIPRADNGWSSLSNLQLLCKECNVSKAANYTDYRFMTPAEIFWSWVKEYDYNK